MSIYHCRRNYSIAGLGQVSRLVRVIAVGAVCFLLAAGRASAQNVCPVPEFASGLQLPLGIIQSNQGNFLVTESGIRASNSSRISIVDPDGGRRTLLSGLPSGINDVNEPSGASAIAMRGRTLYVAIGVGDVGRPGIIPGTVVPNPNPSSPIFSSILAIHFSAHVEKTTTGFTLSLADQQALASGEDVTISYGGGQKITIELVANFPDFIIDPVLPPGAVRLSNPFDMVVVGNQLYVTDGGRNLVWQVDIGSGEFSALASFPPILNPLPFGPPVIDAVPTGIAYSKGQLFVTLFRGFPFVPGRSVVEQVDPDTGAHAPLIAGTDLKALIDVLPLKEKSDTSYLVLQHASGAPATLSPPGRLLHVDTPGQPPQLVADCLNFPTSMVLDEKTGTLYVTELVPGRIVAIPVGK